MFFPEGKKAEYCPSNKVEQGKESASPAVLSCFFNVLYVLTDSEHLPHHNSIGPSGKHRYVDFTLINLFYRYPDTKLFCHATLNIFVLLPTLMTKILLVHS